MALFRDALTSKMAEFSYFSQWFGVSEKIKGCQGRFWGVPGELKRCQGSPGRGGLITRSLLQHVTHESYIRKARPPQVDDPSLGVSRTNYPRSGRGVRATPG